MEIEERQVEHKKNKERQKYIDKKICPDCGRQLTESREPEFGDYWLYLSCPIHGRFPGRLETY